LDLNAVNIQNIYQTIFTIVDIQNAYQTL